MQNPQNLFFNSFGSIADIFGTLGQRYTKNNAKTDFEILLDDWRVLANDFSIAKRIMKVG